MPEPQYAESHGWVVVVCLAGAPSAQISVAGWYLASLTNEPSVRGMGVGRTWAQRDACWSSPGFSSPNLLILAPWTCLEPTPQPKQMVGHSQGERLLCCLPRPRWPSSRRVRAAPWLRPQAPSATAPPSSPTRSAPLMPRCAPQLPRTHRACLTSPCVLYGCSARCRWAASIALVKAVWAQLSGVFLGCCARAAALRAQHSRGVVQHDSMQPSYQGGDEPCYQRL